MTSEGNLEVEEFEHVPLVRMEDVQPSRTCEKVEEDNEISIRSELSQESQGEEVLSFVDASEIHFIVDDSNIGSMVSIQTENVEEEPEITVPEMMESDEDDMIQESQLPSRIQPSVTTIKTTTSGGWPTLEILPGGVINLLSEKALHNSRVKNGSSNENSLMYACAKCPERFNYLFSLVRHVKLHEVEDKRNNIKKPLSLPAAKPLSLPAAKPLGLPPPKSLSLPPPIFSKKIIRTAKKMADLAKRSTEIDQKFVEVTRERPQQAIKVRKHKVPGTKEKYICLEGGTIKLLNKSKRMKVPKKKS